MNEKAQSWRGEEERSREVGRAGTGLQLGIAGIGLQLGHHHLGLNLESAAKFSSFLPYA